METAGDDTFQILLDCVESGQNCSNGIEPSIFMVPGVLRDLNPGSFEPRVVSIGPLHTEHKNVQKSSGLKESYLHDLFHSLDSSDSTREQKLKACLQKVKTSIPKIKASYSDMQSTVSDNDLAKMMVLDGCFILEFCYKHCKNYKKYLPNKMQNVCIAVDLILVENQIPFFVLQDLFDCTLKNHVSIPLTSFLHKILATYFHPFENPLPDVATDSTYDHILGLFHTCYDLPQTKPSLLFGDPIHETPSVPDVAIDSTFDRILGLFHRRHKLPQTDQPLDNKEPTVHSVVELDRAGVNFKPHQDKNLPMTIQFKSSWFVCFPFSRGKPTLLLPQLVIDDYSEPVFRNFIAYEQCVPQVHYNFTSYAYAMDKLVDTEDDVSKLVESKVLVHRLGSNEEAANLINKICKNSSLVDYCYTQQLKQVDNYYNGYWPKNIAWLRRTYFNSPWNAIALIAGIILFSLTVVQTVFSILQVV